MKSKNLFSSLFPTYFLISLLGILILVVIAKFAIQNFYYEKVERDLVQKTLLIESSVEQLLSKKEKLKSFSKKLAQNIESRITILNTQGEVLADSSSEELVGRDISTAEEIQAHGNGEVSQVIRKDQLTDQEVMFVVVPLNKGSHGFASIRYGVSVSSLKKPLNYLIRNVLFWSTLLLIVLAYFIYLKSKRISDPIEQIKWQLERFAQNEFQENIEIPNQSIEEFSSLFDSIESMSKRINKQYQKIVKQKNEQLAVFGSMLEGVITIYPDMNISHINKAAIRLFRLSSNYVPKGTPLSDVVESERIYNMAKELLVNHKSVDYEFEYGEGFILNVHGTILESEDTGMLGAVLVFNDISKMRELENHRKQFVANVSHELKTPLTAIQGYLETILDGDINDPVMLKKFLGIMDKHSTRLKRIIDDLLALSSIEKESEVVGLDFQAVEITPILENVLLLCQQKASDKGISFSLESLEIIVNVNPPLIEQAFINLLDNAIKYGPKDSLVNIKVELSTDSVSVHIIDKGQGIPQEHHERLFERFYAVDKARSRELGGSGLGLSIVKHIALSHRGNVRVESESGRGSVFTIDLPL